MANTKVNNSVVFEKKTRQSKVFLFSIKEERLSLEGAVPLVALGQHQHELEKFIK